MPITCFYSIVRYVPDVIRGESVNIGVVVEAKDKGNKIKEFKFTERFNRAAKIDPHLNVSALEQVAQHALEQIRVEAQGMELNDLVANYSGGKIQLTQPRLTIVDDLEREVNELYDQFIVDEKEGRRHGVTDPILKKEVKEILAKHGFKSDKLRFHSSKDPVAVNGKRATHTFDISVQVNSHYDFIRCISFDVEDYLTKISATKVLAYDAKDVKEKHKRAEVISILHPPQRFSGKERNRAFNEARLILKDEDVPVFNVTSQGDQKELLALLNPEGNGHS